jgi:hypothetical protein
MTASFQASYFNSIENENGDFKMRSESSQQGGLKLFQVDIENFDNEVESYEIEAKDFADAAEQAEARFYDIYNMNIYEIL